MKHFRLLFCAALLILSTTTIAAPQTPVARTNIDKVNGGIITEAGQAYGDLSTVNGGIDLERSSRAKNVETVNGGIEAADNVTVEDVSTVNGGIRFGHAARIDGDAETVNGGIFIGRGGQVRGGISTVNGGIGIVGTSVEGRIDTVNGDITVGADSSVKGGIKVEKNQGGLFSILSRQKIPRIIIGPNAVVEGPLVFEREVKLFVHTSARIGSVSGATAQRYEGSTPPGM